MPVLERVRGRLEEFMRSHPAERYYLFFSGGRDSTVVLAAAAGLPGGLRERIIVVYNELVGNTAVANVEQAYRILEALGFPRPVVVGPYKREIAGAIERGARVLHIRALGRGRSFPEAIEAWGVPLQTWYGRWCWLTFKREVWNRLPPSTIEAGVPVRYEIVGVRRSESTTRARLWASGVRERRIGGTRIVMYSPIYDMTEREVEEALAEAGLDRLMVTYRYTRDSLNCILCPFRMSSVHGREKQRRIIEWVARHEPEKLERLLEALEKLSPTSPTSRRIREEWIRMIREALEKAGKLEATA